MKAGLPPSFLNNNEKAVSVCSLILSIIIISAQFIGPRRRTGLGKKDFPPVNEIKPKNKFNLFFSRKEVGTRSV